MPVRNFFYYVHHEEPAPAGGFLEIVDINTHYAPPYRVGWRADRRSRWNDLVMNDEKFETLEEAMEAFPRLLQEFKLGPDQIRDMEKKKQKDPQRARVYKVGRSFDSMDILLNETEATAFANHVFSQFDIPVPQLKFKKPRTSSRGNFFRTKTTTLGQCNMFGIDLFVPSKHVFLHEYAHWIVFQVYGKVNDKIAPHGPEFVGIFFRLMEKFQNIHMLEMVTRANAAGVKYKLNLDEKVEALFSAS